MSEELNYTKGIGSSYANLGEMYNNLSDFALALENHKKALEVRIASGRSELLQAFSITWPCRSAL